MNKLLFLFMSLSILYAQPDISQQLKALGISDQQLKKLIEQKTPKKKSKESVSQKPTTLPESLLVEKKPQEFSIVEKAFMRNFTLEPDTVIEQFGYDIFKAESTVAFDTLNFNLPVGPNYIIGPGDEIIINLWSDVYQQTFDLFVDNYGKIILPKAGATYVWGMTFKEAQEHIKKRLNKHFTNVKFDIALGKIRTVSVIVVGEINRPGIYRIYPVASPVHLLYLAGGVRKTGTLRKIKIIKKDGSTKYIDLYDLLVKGESIPIFSFEDGDILFVPVLGNVAAVIGAVKRPGIYEIKNETTVAELISLAGGFLPTTYRYHLQLQRVISGRILMVKDEIFSSPEEATKVLKRLKFENGDLVIVKPVSPELRGYVAVTGNVFRPGSYQLSDSTSIRDLIKVAGGLKPGTYMERAEIVRHADSLQKRIISFSLKDVLDGKTRGPKLEEFDTLVIHSLSDIVPVDSVTVVGGVERAGKYQFTLDMTLADLLTVCGGIHAGADLRNIEILRVKNGEFSRINVDLTKERPEEIPLAPGDLVNIPSPVRAESSFVYVEGEVKRPGIYPIIPGKDRLVDLIDRAGGFTSNANPQALELYRKRLSSIELNGLTQMLDIAYTEILREQNALESMNVPKERKELRSELLKRQERFVRMLMQNLGKDTIVVLDTAKIETLSVILSKITPFTNGRLALNFNDTTNFNLLVLPGDSIYVPPVSRTVTVMGFVNYPITLPHVIGKDAKYYIERAGGFSSIADKSKTFVILPGGEASTDLSEIPPGSIIVVPGKVELKPTKLEILKDVVGIIYQVALAYIAILQVKR